jgi:hypothetical protein
MDSAKGNLLSATNKSETKLCDWSLQCGQRKVSQTLSTQTYSPKALLCARDHRNLEWKHLSVAITLTEFFPTLLLVSSRFSISKEYDHSSYLFRYPVGYFVQKEVFNKSHFDNSASKKRSSFFIALIYFNWLKRNQNPVSLLNIDKP